MHSPLRKEGDQEFVKVVTNVGGNLDNLKRLKSEQEQLLLDTKLEHIRNVLRDERKPFRFNEIRSRYRFMVIEGKSKTGKTVFTKWMTGTVNSVYLCLP